MSKRLAYIVDSAYKNDDVELCRSAFNEYQISHCYYPTYQDIYDAHTQTHHKIMIPCGKCYHCIETKINEWCTRMYAHAEDFKHVYFVTLTYRSFYDINNLVNKLILSKLSDAIWHLDNKNSTHRIGYNPCLLVKSHYQNFIKRLRKYTGLNDITYVLSGEYGHDFGRPHFHMILFTNGELTKHDIVRAWSVCLWRKNNGEFVFRRNQKNDGQPYDFPIGRVDFNDLVTNGTFNTTAKVRVDGTYMNAANCFAYVCKYVCKRDNVNFNRVKIAYHALYHKKTFVKCFSNEMEFSIVKQYLQSVGYPFESINDIYNNLKQYTYEKSIFEPTQNVYKGSELSPKKTISLFGHSACVPLYPEKFVDFRTAFMPFCEFSRSTPIGSIYAKRNIQEFAEGVFTKPLLQNQSFVVPSYFRRKAKEYLFGLRQCSKTFRSTSYNLGGLVDLLGHFEKSLSYNIPPVEHFVTGFHTESDYSTYLQTCRRTFRDNYTGERIVLADQFARHFKYDRSLRKYVNTQNIPLQEWIKTQVLSLREEFKRYDDSSRKVTENLHFRDRAFCMMTDLGLDTSLMRDSFIESSKAVRDQIQYEYFNVHNNVE